MSGRYKRKLEDFDPTKSDSDDDDYDAASPPTRAHGRSRKSRSKPRKGHKRQRKDGYGESSDEIEYDDDDDESEEESFQESDDDEAKAVNPRTGRRIRTTASKPIKYEESDDDAEEESERDPIQPTPRKKARRTIEEPDSVMVTLRMQPATLKRALRARTREPTPRVSGGLGTRRSSRISQDDQAPLVALTDSGKHEIVTRAGTATPEPPSSRKPQRATKGLKKPPSAIMEASQEGTQDYEALMNEEEGDVEGDEYAAHPDMTTSAYGDTQPIDDDEDELQAAQPITAEPEINESADDDDDDDEGPVRGIRKLRERRKASTPPIATGRRSLRQRKTGAEPSSDFEPDAEGEEDEEAPMSDSDGMLKPRHNSSNEGSRRAGRRKGRSSQRSRSARHESEEDDDEIDPDELADEAALLQEDNRRSRRSRRKEENAPAGLGLRTRGAQPDYRIFRPENLIPDEDDTAPPNATPSRARKGASTFYRNMFQTAGPFGGLGGPTPLFGGPEGQGAAGGVDSDSSDDDMGIKQVGGAVGMTPTSAFPKPYAAPQALNNDPVVASGGGPAGLGRVKDRKALADADPLGVDPNVGFESVGGLDDHIDRLKEMVMLPLLYPEVFQRFHVTPPRGVLFHGPPGTGKTLLARALASSVSSNGRKVTFYMRKGADALSKWVGEAEKQLRLLFEEARKNQPSIIFFDEIDGLAPVRSSKQEQIHASIVATLLALMDGMDGRGQVIVIGATNRPDSVDPALRRPGRFDREFYFPLPALPARRAIIDIHTKGWEPALEPRFKDQLAELTKGYGGADLRALCTEAALNAVQGTYPQIYSSDQKLVIDPTTIKVLAKDFMISVGKIIPSSERSAASGAAPLKKEIEPLLRKAMGDIMEKVDKAIPRKRKATALEEAMYDDREDEHGFERETQQRLFEAARIFRPRLLIKGLQGMGQQYLGSALLSKLEGVHVQNFGLPVLLADSTRSPEAAIVQLFEEVKRHKPSIVYIPNIDTWYKTLSDSAIKTFAGLMRSLPPTEPILLLGVLEYMTSEREIDNNIIRDLFSYSLKAQYRIDRPSEEARREFFKKIITLVRQPPSEFPNPEGRKRRKLDVLPIAAAQPVLLIEPSKADLKAQKKKDRQTLNLLKLSIQQVMDQIKLKYKKFRAPVIDDSAISYLYDDENPQLLLSDMPEEQRQDLALLRPYEIDKDEKGFQGLREIATGRFFYNLEIVTIEKRLSNGYYKRPKDFLADIKRLAKDAKTINDQDRILKANEMLANVEVDMATLEVQQPALVAECEAVYERELLREHERAKKERDALRQGEEVPIVVANVPPPVPSKTTTETTGPVVLGEELSGRKILPPQRPLNLNGPWSDSNGIQPPPHSSKDSELYDASIDPRPHPIAASAPNQPTGFDTPINPNRSYHTQMPFNSQMDPIQNSASTTSSGLKTGQNSSDKNKSSGQNSAKTNTSLPVSQYPAFERMPGRGGSQLPDTQSSQSQPEPTSPVTAPTLGGPGLMPPPAKPAGPAEAAPPFEMTVDKPTEDDVPQVADMQRPAPTATMAASASGKPGEVAKSAMQPVNTAAQASPDKPENPLAVTLLLNEAMPEPPSSHPRLIIDEKFFQDLHTILTKKTSGLSVEQLEQVQSSLMEAIWETKSEWNRMRVAKLVEDAFNAIIEDIGECQRVLKASQEDE